MTSRIPLLLASGIVLFAGACILVIARLDGDVVVRTPPPAQELPPPAPMEQAAAPVVLPATVPEGAAPVAPPPPPESQARTTDYRAMRRRLAARAAPASAAAVRAAPPVELPPAPPTSAWDDVQIVSPFGAGTPAPAVTRALTALKPQLADCFAPETQARWDQLGPAYSQLGKGALGKTLGPAILVLEVEGDGSQVKIVDAPAETRGSAGEGALNCAQATLRGATLPVATEGKTRFRMRWPLRP